MVDVKYGVVLMLKDVVMLVMIYQYVVNFVKIGNLNGEGFVIWEVFDLVVFNMMDFNWVGEGSYVVDLWKVCLDVVVKVVS